MDYSETNRDFKGIWIPREVWFNQDLKLIQKLFLIEIDSLDKGERGCYASNQYFAKFFSLTPPRCSQIIKDLRDMKLISIDYQWKGKEIKERNIHLTEEGIKFIKGGIKKIIKIYNNSNTVSKDTDSGSEEPLQSSSTDDRETKRLNKNVSRYIHLLKQWNDIPSTTTHNMNKSTKTLDRIFILFRQLERGTFCRYTGITAAWLRQNNIPEEAYSRKFSLEAISVGIERMGRQFESGYWPYTEAEKKRILPRSLADSLYSPHGGCLSTFLKVFYNPPKKIDDLPQDQYPHLTTLYCQKFLKKKFEDLTRTDQSKIILGVGHIVKFHEKQSEVLFPIYKGTRFSNHFGRPNDVSTFMLTHIDWLLNKGGVYRNKEPFHDNFRPTVQMMQPRGNRWERFKKDFEEVIGYNIDPSESQIIKLKKIYSRR